MSIPQNKIELMEAIEMDYLKLQAELVNIPIELTRNKELQGHAKGTLMSICDLVAYLVGWGNLVLKWHDKKTKGLHVDFPETGYNWGQLGELAQKFYKDHEADSYPALLQKLFKSKKDILGLVNSCNNKALYNIPWEGKWTMGRCIQLNMSSPYKNALNRIRLWKKEKSRMILQG